MVFTGVVLIYGGISIMKLTMIQKTASLGSIPMGVIYSILPVTGVLIFIYSILNIIDLCVGKEQDHRDVKE